MATGRSWKIERDLKAALCGDIARLEAGLEIADGGKERMVVYGGDAKPGWIDITCKDAKGATVVIELKRGKAGRRAVGQILGYMGVLMRDTKRVRGILVAKEFSPQGRAAASMVPTLQLIEHGRLPFRRRQLAESLPNLDT